VVADTCPGKVLTRLWVAAKSSVEEIEEVDFGDFLRRRKIFGEVSLVLEGRLLTSWMS